MTVGFYVIIVPPIVVAAAGMVKYIKSRINWKITVSVIVAICFIVPIVILIVALSKGGTLREFDDREETGRIAAAAPEAGRPAEPKRNGAAKREPKPQNITRSQLIRETRTALNLAERKTGVKTYGFAADECLIGNDKATCHFHCYADGIKYVGGIEFYISGGNLIPSGKFYLDAD